MHRKYQHITQDERDLIALWHAQGLSLSKIAGRLRRNKGSISRELRRNSSGTYDVYLSHNAHRRAIKRKKQSGRRPRLKSDRIRCYVTEKIRKGWSPELIAGRIKKRHPDNAISHEAIYQFIYDKDTLAAIDLRKYLPRSKYKRRPGKHSRRHIKKHIPDRISIDQRPKFIDQRKQPGHWESDTVATKQSRPSLMVLIERSSRLVKISKLPSKTARDVSSAINRRLAHLPRALRRTITYDNGPENVEHMRVNRTLGTRSYFCNPYHSWEKGSVENVISLIRRYLPKKTDISTITKEQIKHIENQLNNRPKKCLDFYTPLEIFSSVALPG